MGLPPLTIEIVPTRLNRHLIRKGVVTSLSVCVCVWGGGGGGGEGRTGI